MTELQDFVGGLVNDIQRIRMECADSASSRMAYFGISALLEGIGYYDEKPRIRSELRSGTWFVVSLDTLLGVLNDESNTLQRMNTAYAYTMAYAAQTQLPVRR